MEKKYGALKVFYIIGIIVLVGLLCYFSIAMYFYFAKPNDLSTKLSVYNMMSDDSIGEMYLEASFDIEREGEEETFYGINVDADGYVLTICSNLDNDYDSTLTLYSENGGIYDGKVVFADEYFNLAVIKIYNRYDKDSDINLPYVSIGGMNALGYQNNCISIGKPSDENAVTTISSIKYYSYVLSQTMPKDGLDVVDFVYETPLVYVDSSSTNAKGAILDKKGNLLGLYLDLNTFKENNYYALEVGVIDVVLDDIKALDGEFYSNDLVNAFIGYDMFEFDKYYEHPLTENSQNLYIYYNDDWHLASSAVVDRYLSGYDGFYLTEDLVYNGVTLEAGNFITVISYGGRSYNVRTRAEFANMLYSLDSGTSITLSSYNLNNNLELVTSNFVVI